MKSIVIPSTIKEFTGNNSFSSTNLEKVTFADGLIEMPDTDKTHFSSYNLKDMYFPKSLKMIGSKFIFYMSADSKIIFHYDGTKAEFDKIEKADDWLKWENNTPESKKQITVICTDGEFTIKT